MESSGDAYEESTEGTTGEEQQQVGHDVVGSDAWAFMVVRGYLGVREVVNCSAVCRSWRQLLSSDRVWRALLLRHSVPVPPRGTSCRLHFLSNALSILGPTTPFRRRLHPSSFSLPPPVVSHLSALLASRRLALRLVGHHVLLNDEIGLVSLELAPPFRITTRDFEADSSPQRRSWSDGLHVVVQSQFVSKSTPMTVRVFRLVLRKSGIELVDLGTVQPFGDNQYPYLMNVFFEKSTCFFLEYHDSVLANGAIYRVDLTDLTVKASFVFPGGGLLGGQPMAENDMPVSAYSLGHYHIVRKFPNAPLQSDRERLFVLDQNLNVLHDYTCPVGDRWRYPFIRRAWGEYLVLDAHSSDKSWSKCYKLGGPVVLEVFRLCKDGMEFLPGGLMDVSGMVLTELVRKKSSTVVRLSYHSFDPAAKKPVRHIVDEIDTGPGAVEAKWFRCFHGMDGQVLFMYLPPHGNSARVRLLHFKLSANGDQSNISGTVGKKKLAPVPAEAGTDSLQRELMAITDQMSVDELMELVAEAKHRLQTKSARK